MYGRYRERERERRVTYRWSSREEIESMRAALRPGREREREREIERERERDISTEMERYEGKKRLKKKNK
jgi:hypothetical protein